MRLGVADVFALLLAAVVLAAVLAIMAGPAGSVLR